MAKRGVNKVILVGFIGQDPETRFASNQTMVTTLSLATTQSWRDKQTNEPKEATEWHRIVLFGRLGEIAGEYLKKGSQAYVEGYLQTRKWQDQQGQDRYTTEIVAQDMQMLDSRGGDSGAAPLGGGQNRGRRSGSAQAPARLESGPVTDDF